MGWIALAEDLRFPPSFINGRAAIPDCCQFDHSRHRECGRFVAKTTFRTRTGFCQERYSLVIQGKEDGAQASFELEAGMPVLHGLAK